MTLTGCCFVHTLQPVAGTLQLSLEDKQTASLGLCTPERKSLPDIETLHAWAPDKTLLPQSSTLNPRTLHQVAWYQDS